MTVAPEQRAEEGSSENYELAILFGLAFNSMIDELHARLSQLGYADIRPAHGFVFQAIGPTGATASEIAHRLGVTKQAASQMIDFLVGAGYVTRQKHPRDGRGKLLNLTERGWQCLGASGAILRDIERRWAERLGGERLERMRRDLMILLQDEASEGKDTATGKPAHLPAIRPVW